MPSGWDTYYVVCLSAVLALAVPLSLRIVSWLFSRNRAANLPSKVQASVQATAEGEIGHRTNVRFFSGTNVALVLIAFALVLIPCSAAFKSDAEGDVEQLLCIVSICVFAGLGLLYAARKGDLRWLSSFKDSDRGDGGGFSRGGTE